MKTIIDIINSRYNKVNRYGDIKATWYEDGQQHTDIIKVNKADRDYHYNKMTKAYDALIEGAPEPNRAIIRTMVAAFLADNFTEDAYRLSIVSGLDAKTLMLNLKPYYNK